MCRRGLQGPLPLLPLNAPFPVNHAPILPLLNLLKPAPLKLNLLRVQTNPLSYIPWRKAELPAGANKFSTVTEAPHRSGEEFNTVIQTYNPGFSDAYQLAHMRVGEGQTGRSRSGGTSRRGIERNRLLTSGETLEPTLESLPSHYSSFS